MSTVRYSCICWLVLLLHLQPLEGKRQSGSLRIGGPLVDQRWHYISKFGYALGQGTYLFRMRLKEPANNWKSDKYLQFQIYLDEDWHKVETLPACHRSLVTKGVARRTEQIALKADGTWGPWRSGNLYQIVRPHIWYFTISDCLNSLSSDTYGIEFEFQAQQFDGSEFSLETRYMLLANSLIILVFSAFLARYCTWCVEFRHSTGVMHPVIRALSLIMATQCIAQILLLWHLWRYRADGQGMWVADALSEVLFMLSQVGQTTLIISIASGYTLSCSKGRGFTLMKPLAALILAVHAVLVAVGKLQDDASFKYHENEGNVGWTLFSIRLLLYTWFILAVQASQECGGFRLQLFLRQFKAVGSMYLLAYPLLFCFVQLLAPYLQHPVLQIGLLATQLGSNVWLANLFLKRGTYFEVSTLSSSMLPGGAGGLNLMTSKEE